MIIVMYLDDEVNINSIHCRDPFSIPDLKQLILLKSFIHLYKL